MNLNYSELSFEWRNEDTKDKIVSFAGNVVKAVKLKKQATVFYQEKSFKTI